MLASREHSSGSVGSFRWGRHVRSPQVFKRLGCFPLVGRCPEMRVNKMDIHRKLQPTSERFNYPQTRPHNKPAVRPCGLSTCCVVKPPCQICIHFASTNFGCQSRIAQLLLLKILGCVLWQGPRQGHYALAVPTLYDPRI